MTLGNWYTNRQIDSASWGIASRIKGGIQITPFVAIYNTGINLHHITSIVTPVILHLADAQCPPASGKPYFSNLDNLELIY